MFPVLMHQTETFDLIGFAVAIGVAKGHDVAAGAFLRLVLLTSSSALVNNPG